MPRLGPSSLRSQRPLRRSRPATPSDGSSIVRKRSPPETLGGATARPERSRRARRIPIRPTYLGEAAATAARRRTRPYNDHGVATPPPACRPCHPPSRLRAVARKRESAEASEEALAAYGYVGRTRCPELTEEHEGLLRIIRRPPGLSNPVAEAWFPAVHSAERSGPGDRAAPAGSSLRPSAPCLDKGASNSSSSTPAHATAPGTPFRVRWVRWGRGPP